MKTIGLLGGMSWESSALYYKLINELVRDELGGLHSAKIVMASVDFAEIEETQRSGDWERAGELLAVEAAHIQAGGAELLVICTNTMHKVTPAIEAAITIPLLHIVDATAAVVTDAGIRTVGLLGTAFTMEQDFYRERLESNGLTVLIPEAAERAIIHRVIYEELVLGIVKESSRQQYRQIIAALCERGVEGIILGCTEIELLVTETDSAVPVFPTTLIHAQAAVQAALAD